ncbi:MAG: site-specific DNA-methyltransferase [Chloroflexota bacterium]
MGETIQFCWPGKEEAIQQIHCPTNARLVPSEEASLSVSSHLPFQVDNHLFIEGDNLTALKLLEAEYAKRVQVIYIDPPYNTGKDFVYDDKLTAVPGVNGQGAGTIAMRRHAAWLSMIYPRLAVARRLLREDGLIFISIDDNEVHHLRLILNEIFGEENFVTQFVWHSSTAGGIRSKYVNRNHEYVLCYARDLTCVPKLFAPLSQEAIKQYSRKDVRGTYREKDFAWITKSINERQRYLIECPDGTWVQPRPGYLFRYVQERFEQALADELVVFKATDTSPLIDDQGRSAPWNIYIKKYLGDGKGAPASLIPKSIVGLYNHGTEEIKAIFGAKIFENPKPTAFLRYFIEMGLGVAENPQEGIVLDFFAGTCSTAHAVLKMNAEDGGQRRFIMVQQAEETPARSLARKIGFETISEMGIERIRCVGKMLDRCDEMGLCVQRIEDDLHLND